MARSILKDVVERLARRTEGRTEADIQSDVRLLLLTAELDLEDQDLVEPPKLESQAGAGRGIDVELGATVIEVEKDLRSEHLRKKAAEQLATYVHHGVRAPNERKSTLGAGPAWGRSVASGTCGPSERHSGLGPQHFKRASFCSA